MKWHLTALAATDEKTFSGEKIFHLDGPKDFAGYWHDLRNQEIFENYFGEGSNGKRLVGKTWKKCTDFRRFDSGGQLKLVTQTG